MLRPGDPPAMGVRHDVDLLLWTFPACTDSQWQPKHEGTLDAFGFVQASKVQKKYTMCSPNMLYSVIAEPKRHIFFYKAQYGTAEFLKNRFSGRVQIGQQRLFEMDKDATEICGMIVEDEVTVLITANEINVFQVNA